MPQLPAAQVTAAPASGREPEAVPRPSPTPSPQRVSGPTAGMISSLDAQIQLGLSNRLEVLFQRFLVGKLLGADLLLPSGQLLAVSGSEITRDMVQVAEENGVLPGLIAHMVLPGSGAD